MSFPASVQHTTGADPSTSAAGTPAKSEARRRQAMAERFPASALQAGSS
jgi:hypothetical protein